MRVYYLPNPFVYEINGRLTFIQFSLKELYVQTIVLKVDK